MIAGRPTQLEPTALANERAAAQLQSLGGQRRDTKCAQTDRVGVSVPG